VHGSKSVNVHFSGRMIPSTILLNSSVLHEVPWRVALNSYWLICFMGTILIYEMQCYLLWYEFTWKLIGVILQCEG